MSDIGSALVTIPSSNVEIYRMSTDAAGLCGQIVKATAQKIQGKSYVKVEGWQAIAVAHGCVASSREVEAVEGGIRAIGEIRRMTDGFVIATAEGFVGDDETMWAKRPMFARRAMAQTRAISRACRSAFAHVVVMIDASLQTTPAEEMQGVFDHEPVERPSVSNAATNSIDDTRREIAMQTGSDKSTYRIKAEANAKKWTDTAIEALRFANLPGEIDGWWADNEKATERLLSNHPEEFARLEKASQEQRDALVNKAA